MTASNTIFEFQPSGSGASTKISRDDQKWVVQLNPYSETPDIKRNDQSHYSSLSEIKKPEQVFTKRYSRQKINKSTSSLENSAFQLPDLKCYTSRQTQNFSPTRKSPTLKITRKLRKSVNKQGLGCERSLKKL